MLFPDCRNDDVYNERFLEDRDEQFIQGFDLVFSEVINLIADNLDSYDQELTELCPEGYEPEEDEAFSKREDLYEILEDNKEIICAIIKDWLENVRNEVITSSIDDYSEETFDFIKDEVMIRNPELKEKLYDTRKYMVTGKKEPSEIIEE